MANQKLIPLAQHPEYQAAASKVAQISSALTRTKDEMQALQEELHRVRMASEQQPDEHGATMARALAIADGSQSAPSTVPTDIQSDINRLMGQKSALQAGLIEANRLADEVASKLGRQAGEKAREKHLAAVKHVLECLETLCKANDAEEAVRNELEQLGYHRHGLQVQGFTAVGRIDDWTGSPAFYFSKDAKTYLGTK